MSRPPAQSVQELIDRGSLAQLAGAAELLLAGEVPSGDPALNRVGFKHGMLRWAVSPDATAALQWSALGRDARQQLAAKGRRPHPEDRQRYRLLADRDRYVEALWRTLWNHPKHEDLRHRIAEHWRAEPEYHQFLLLWFLRRLDLPAALRVYTGRLTSHLLLPALAVATVSVVASVLSRRGATLVAGLAALVTVVVLAFAAAAVARLASRRPDRQPARLPAFAFAQALVPRLGAAVALGYLFLATAPELVGFLLAWERPAAWRWGAVAILALAVWAYVGWHVLQRVEPRPALRRAATRAGHLLAVALGWAAAELTLAAPLLVAVRGGRPDDLRPDGLALVTLIALALGVLLQLAWDEGPLTDPL